MAVRSPRRPRGKEAMVAKQRHLWVVEHADADVNQGAVRKTKAEAENLRRWLIRDCGVKSEALRVVRYSPTVPR